MDEPGGGAAHQPASSAMPKSKLAKPPRSGGAKTHDGGRCTWLITGASVSLIVASSIGRLLSPGADVARDPSLEYFEFNTGDVSIDGMLSGLIHEEASQVHAERRTSPFYVFPQLVPLRVATAVVNQAKADANTFKTDSDSIDGSPSYEKYVIEHGRVVHPAIHDLLQPILGSVVDKVREAIGCPTCELCDVLVRRYVHGERRGVGIHRDINAYVTSILTLNAEDFTGGYYVVSHDRTPSGGSLMGLAAARQLHLALKSGDLLIHGYNVLHGVNVTSGARYSVIGWFKDRAGLCASDANPWVHELADTGDADAMNQLMQKAIKDGDVSTAQRWAERAAAAGHTGAMTFRAMGLFRSKLPEDRAEAARLVEAASHAGRRDAMALYAWALDSGACGRVDRTEALTWRRRAATLGHEAARRELQAAGLTVEETGNSA